MTEKKYCLGRKESNETNIQILCSFSGCHGSVCDLWLCHFLVILTRFFMHSYPGQSVGRTVLAFRTIYTLFPGYKASVVVVGTCPAWVGLRQGHFLVILAYFFCILTLDNPSVEKNFGDSTGL